jgi:hypothetical protein
MQHQSKAARDQHRVTPDEKYEGFTIKTRATRFAWHVWINAKQFLIVFKKVGAGQQRDEEKTGKNDPKDEKELSVILHA